MSTWGTHTHPRYGRAPNLNLQTPRRTAGFLFYSIDTAIAFSYRYYVAADPVPFGRFFCGRQAPKACARMVMGNSEASKPLGVRLNGDGFKSESAAKLAGEKALRQLLDGLAQEKNL